MLTNLLVERALCGLTNVMVVIGREKSRWVVLSCLVWMQKHKVFHQSVCESEKSQCFSEQSTIQWILFTRTMFLKMFALFEVLAFFTAFFVSLGSCTFINNWTQTSEGCDVFLMKRFDFSDVTELKYVPGLDAHNFPQSHQKLLLLSWMRSNAAYLIAALSMSVMGKPHSWTCSKDRWWDRILRFPFSVCNLSSWGSSSVGCHRADTTNEYIFIYIYI